MAAPSAWGKLAPSDFTNLKINPLTKTGTASQQASRADMNSLHEVVRINGYAWRKGKVSRSGTVSYWNRQYGHDHFTVSPVKNASGLALRRIENFHWTYYNNGYTYHYRFKLGSGSLGGEWDATRSDANNNFGTVYFYSTAIMQRVKAFANALGYTCEVQQAVPAYATAAVQAALTQAAAATPPAAAASTSASSSASATST